MPQNAMMAGNQQRQNVWLQAWQQRQKQQNPGAYNASWMPAKGWRGRFNQSQQQPAWKTEPKAPVPGSYEHTGPRPGYDPNPRPDGTYGPPLPPVYSAPGWRTLAPTGVPEGGWGGGAIEHTPGHLISGTPGAPPAPLPNPPSTGPVGPPGGIGGSSPPGTPGGGGTPPPGTPGYGDSPYGPAPRARQWTPTGQWSSQAPGQSRWPGNAMNRYKPSAMQEY